MSRPSFSVSPMGGFSKSVDSLLETYSTCLSLLKGLKGPDNSRQTHQLRKCIRSDRSKVRRIYSSRLSLNGSNFEKGDSAARSSLRRVTKRLTSAMTRLLRVMTRAQSPVIDYQSLRSLSNSSRVDAIKTINNLSRRLSSSSLKSASTSGKKGKRQRSPKSSGRTSKLKHGRSPSVKSSRSKDDDKEKQEEEARGAIVPRADPRKRISMATMSSGSTKLGEIAHKSRRRQINVLEASDEFSIQPTYPLRPYHLETKRKKFWGLFGPG